MRQQTEPQRAALERLLDVAGESAARQILAEVGSPSAQTELERVIAREVAVRLLMAGEPRTLIRDRLMSRGMSKATAYRLIDAALDL